MNMTPTMQCSMLKNTYRLFSIRTSRTVRCTSFQFLNSGLTKQGVFPRLNHTLHGTRNYTRHFYTTNNHKEARKNNSATPHTLVKSASRPSTLGSVYYLFGAFGVSCVGIFLYYRYERHQHILEHDLKINRTSPQGFLQPDLSHSDTYEMGLYVQSQKELEQSERAKRKRFENSNFIIKYLYRFRYWTTDYVIEPCFIVGRFFRLLFIFTPVLVTFPLVSVLPSQLFSYDQFYSILLFCLQKAGPSFIKLGQWAASRTDIFDEKLCMTLGHLHSNVKPHSWKYTEKTLCENLQIDNLDEVFSEINKTPIGCGAIGQVYLGTLKSDLKNPIALKIVHPKVHKIISRDLKIIKFFANVIDHIPTMEWLSLPQEAEQFAFFMQLQLDFRIECCNLWKFNSQYKHSRQIKFPKYYPDYTTRDILFEEYIDNGVSMEKFLDMKKILANDDQSDIDHNMVPLFKKISDPFIDCFLDMLITYDFIHADLHPGNVILKFWDPQHKEYVSQEKINDLLEKYHACQETVEKTSHIESESSAESSTKRELYSKKDQLKEQLIQILTEYEPKVCLIDVGLVTELNKRNRINFIALFNALAQFDGIKAGNLMIERSRTPETAINKDEFASKVNKLMQLVKKRTFTLGSISIGDLLEQMLSMVRSHHVRMEGDFVSVVVAILLLEGIGKQLDPDLDLFARFVFFAHVYGFGEIYFY